MLLHSISVSGNWAGLGGRSSVPCGVVGHHSVVFDWWIAGLQNARHPLHIAGALWGGWLEGWALLRLLTGFSMCGLSSMALSG